MKTRKSLIIFFIGCVVGFIIYIIANNTSPINLLEINNSNTLNSIDTSATSKSSTSIEADVNSESDNTVDSPNESTEVNSSSVNPTESTSVSESNDTHTSSIENPKEDLQSNWKNTFEKELKDSYNVTVKKYEDLGDGLYGVYVKEIDTGDMPYVTVDSKTGNFHG